MNKIKVNKKAGMISIDLPDIAEMQRKGKEVLDKADKIAGKRVRSLVILDEAIEYRRALADVLMAIKAKEVLGSNNLNFRRVFVYLNLKYFACYENIISKIEELGVGESSLVVDNMYSIENLHKLTEFIFTL